MSDFFKSYVSGEPKFPEFAQCPEVTKHPFKLVKAQPINSFENMDGSQKDNLPDWEDPTPQWVLIFESLRGKGGHVQRYNGGAYLRFSELTKAQVESGEYVESSGVGYALKEHEGHMVRISDPKRTEACFNILNQLFYALGIAKGTAFKAGIDKAMADEYVFLADIVVEKYKDPESGNTSDQFRMKNYRPVPEGFDVTAEAEADWSEENQETE